MKYNIGTAYDTNPVRITLVAGRNKKNSHFSNFITNSVFSTLIIGFLFAAVQIL